MQKHIDELEEQLQHYQLQQQDRNAASDDEGEGQAVVGEAAGGILKGATVGQAGETQASVAEEQEYAAAHEQDGLGYQPGDFGVAAAVAAFGTEPVITPELPPAGASGDVLLGTLHDLPLVAAAEEQDQQQQQQQEEHLGGGDEEEGLLPPLPVAEPVTPGEEGAGPDAAAAVAAVVAAAGGGFVFDTAVPQHTSPRGQEAAGQEAGQEVAEGVGMLSLPPLQPPPVDEEREQCRYACGTRDTMEDGSVA